jgi:N6-L-threonylcarbamoyladenine synthase
MDKLAKEGSPIYALPTPKTEGKYDFSFSGLKSGVLQFIKRMERTGTEWRKEDLAASFQEAALKEIFSRVDLALDEYADVRQFVVGGGVSANSRLRQLVQEQAKTHPSVEFVVPPMYCCTDNAAMIAAAGEIAYQTGRVADASMGPDAGWEIC